MLGGDQRELILARRLLELGADLVVAGYPPLPDLAGARRVRSVVEAVPDASVVIAPMTHTDERGVIRAVMEPGVTLRLDEEAFQRMKPGTLLFIGMAQRLVEQLAYRYHIRLIQTAEHDEIAILNSIPTAEGAIQKAMAELPITLHGSRAGVLGFGRCGMTLARMLAALGARTTVVARNPAQIARAYEMGFETLYLDQLASFLPEADVVFNTIPAPVLTRELLERMRTESIIIDIASAPGGTDFAAARELGLKAFLELGLPGRVAPRTAGQILARVIPRLIREELA